MSLTSFLRDNVDVRESFRKEFEKPKFSVKKDMVAPPLTRRYSLVGTAFDYLLRFLLQRLNPNTIDKGYWVAEAALELIADDQKLFSKGERIVTEARKRQADFIKTGRMSDDLVKSALLLAGLDPIFRAGVGHEEIGIVHQEDIQDLNNLISAVDPKTFAAKTLCLVNPTFGEASLLVGGADADLVIDDTIIDIKTTKNLGLDRNDFDQLLGYYVLHEISGVGQLRPKPDIARIAIYFSRYAYLHVLKLSDFINAESFPSFVNWFRQRAAKEYGTEHT